MSDKITIKELEGDYCEQLESCETWDELSSKIEGLVEFSGLKHFESPRAIFNDTDGETYETMIEIRVVKEPYVKDEDDDQEGKVLTKEIAEQFLENDETDTEEFEFIEDAAAVSLSRYKGDSDIYLSGLTVLSDTAAESISKLQGGGDIFLSALTELSDAAAESLSKLHGERYFYLIGLTELSDAAAESLSKLHGTLNFMRLTELSDKAIKSLSKLQGDLVLGVTELSDAAAESLSKHKGDLSLYSLTELSDAAAESLSKHQGNINEMEPRKLPPTTNWPGSPREWVESLKN